MPICCGTTCSNLWAIRQNGDCHGFSRDFCVQASELPTSSLIVTQGTSCARVAKSLSERLYRQDNNDDKRRMRARAARVSLPMLVNFSEIIETSRSAAVCTIDSCSSLGRFIFVYSDGQRNLLFCIFSSFFSVFHFVFDEYEVCALDSQLIGYSYKASFIYNLHVWSRFDCIIKLAHWSMIKKISYTSWRFVLYLKP